MDPQISLEDAFSCFIAGKAMSDVEYKRNQRKIARKVSKSPEYGFRAGKEWDFDRFRPYSFIITEGVSKSSRWSYEAGKEWSDEVFNLDPELIINSIARNSASSYDSFKEMDPSRLQRCASKFLDTVTVLTNKTHDEIIKSKSPLLIAYAVERETGLDFGNQHERLGNVLTLVARLDLGEYEGTGGLAPRKKDRFANSRDILTNYLTGDIKRFEWFERGAAIYNELNEQDQQKYDQGFDRIRCNMLHLSKLEVQKVLTAHSYVDKEQQKKFWYGLCDVVNLKRDPIMWAGHIIDALKQDTIGGGNYREVFNV